MRDGSPKWPRRFPFYKTGALLLTLLCGALLFTAWLRRALPLERFYLTRYTLLSLVPDLAGTGAGTGKKRLPATPGRSFSSAGIRPPMPPSPRAVRLPKFGS
jgi:hypothetical protein